MSDSSPNAVTDHDLKLLAARRKLAILKARESLVDFIKLFHPDPNFPDDVTKSTYEVAPHHLMLCEMVEKSEARDLKRAAQSIPPQHGKSTIISRYGTAWKAGKNPHRHRITGTYNSDFAKEIGEHVRDIIRTPTYKQVFPDVDLKRDSQSKSVMKITFKGKRAGSLTFVGRGEATTGRPADDFTIDDPYKDKAECDSDAVRKQCLDWYKAVVFSRCHVMSTIFIVHTRWHEDDLIGWLCDPEHPQASVARSKRWKYVNVPAVVKDEKLAAALGLKLEPQTHDEVIAQFGTSPMVALWASRFPLSHLAEANDNDPRIFSALYMGRPTPEDGDYFKADWLVGYTRDELPKNLRKYAASDHALTENEENDANCCGVVGIDENDHVWLLPDLFWERTQTDVLVEEMIGLIDRHEPLIWWAARDHISKSIGPALRKRMEETDTYCYVEESPETKDHRTRARSIQARMANLKVHFPTFAPWWQAAKSELLKFPNGKHDDFVSFLAHIGMGLQKQVKATTHKPKTNVIPMTGTMAWLKSQTANDKRQEKRRKSVAGR